LPNPWIMTFKENEKENRKRGWDIHEKEKK
jgi:hypothetical protein